MDVKYYRQEEYLYDMVELGRRMGRANSTFMYYFFLLRIPYYDVKALVNGLDIKRGHERCLEIFIYNALDFEASAAINLYL